jgi:hypothetical protein
MYAEPSFGRWRSNLDADDSGDVRWARGASERDLTVANGWFHRRGSVLNNNGYMPPVALDEKMTDDATTQLVALGVVPETYARILTLTRLRALRFDFLIKRRLAKEDSLRQRLQEAANLCGRMLAHLEEESDG